MSSEKKRPLSEEELRNAITYEDSRVDYSGYREMLGLDGKPSTAIAQALRSANVLLAKGLLTDEEIDLLCKRFGFKLTNVKSSEG